MKFIEHVTLYIEKNITIYFGEYETQTLAFGCLGLNMDPRGRSQKP